MNNKIYVAKLGKTVGLKGQLRVFIDSDFPEQFKKNAVFTTNKNLKLIVKEFDLSRDLIKFEDFEDVDTAKKLTNQELFVSEDETKESCSLAKNQFFWFDIIGCNIIENNENLGKVKDIHRFPLDDYLEISTNLDLVKKQNLPKTFLIPYNTEKYILNVDIENKTIQTKDCFAILENS